jgi:hypothetical protein
MSGNAVQGSNYSLSGTAGQVIIPTGGTSATVTLTELAAAKKTKTATMSLYNGSGYVLKKPYTATVSLTK